MDNLFLDENRISVLTEKRLKHDMNQYNKALIFSPNKAKLLRKKCADVIEKFAERKVTLDSPLYENCDYSICDLMDSYIRTFQKAISKETEMKAREYLEYISPVQTRAREKTFISRLYDARARRIRKLTNRSIIKNMQSKLSSFFGFFGGKKEIVDEEKIRQKDAKEAEKLHQKELKRKQRKEQQAMRRQQKETARQQKKSIRQDKKAAKRQAAALRRYHAQQNKATKVRGGNNSSNSSQKPKRSFFKAAIVTAFVGMAGFAGIFGFNKFKNDHNKDNQKNNVTVAKIDNKVRQAESKDTLNLILANKLAYQEQVKLDTIQKAKVDTVKNAVKPQSTKKVKPAIKKIQAATPKAVSIENEQVAMSATPSQEHFVSRNEKFDSSQAVILDTLFVNNDSVPAIDSISTVNVDTLASDQILSNDTIPSFDTIAQFVNDSTILQDTSIAQSELSEEISDSTSIVNNENEVPSVEISERKHLALDDEIQGPHIDACDSALAIVCGGADKRDSLINQIATYIDAGNFEPTVGMHLSDLTTNILYMSVSSDSTNRSIGNKILDGKKLNPSEQQVIDSLPKWDLPIPKILIERGIFFDFSQPTADQNVVASTTKAKKNSSYYHKKFSSGSSKHSSGCKSYTPKTQGFEKLMQKAFNSGRLSKNR